MANPRLQTRVPQEMEQWLADRSERMYTGSVDIQAGLELGMWRAALAVELRRIRLTLSQANCLADILNGTMLQPGISGTMPLVRMEAADAFHLVRSNPISRDEVTYGAKWDLDEQQLLDYLQSLGPTADHALHDAIVRWWETDAEMSAEGWAGVGVTIIPDQTEGADETPATPGGGRP